MSASWLFQMLVVARIRGNVPLLVHWSVPAVALFILGTGIHHLANAAAWVVGYLAILIIHELGHHFAAEWRRTRVIAISIYPLHGSCQFELPRSPSDEAIIAFGGPAAQFIVAAPFALFIKLFGSTGIAPIDILLAALGVISPIVACFNLLPIAPLDGHRIWVTMRRIRREGSRKIADARTPMEAMEEALRKASRSRGTAKEKRRQVDDRAQ